MRSKNILIKMFFSNIIMIFEVMCGSNIKLNMMSSGVLS